MQKEISDLKSALSVADANIGGDVKNLTGRLEQVARREAEVTTANAKLEAAQARTDAILGMLIQQVHVHDEHDFQMERGESHPH
jgi:hypothetical protein